jgi:outer membrane protein OmpA-like peptidoglycan-associated protein
MRVFKFILPLFCALSLSACSGTIAGMKQDTKEVVMWSHGTGNTALEKDYGRPPTGYTGQNKRGLVLKPPAAIVAGDTGLVWHDIGSLSALDTQAREIAPAAAVPPGGAPEGETYSYADGVQIFPIEGDTARVSSGAVVVPSYDSAPLTAPSSEAYGRLEQKVFFGHGSAAVKKADKAKLHKLAAVQKKKAHNVAVTVVGHASRRVDHVTDPVKKQMINLAMAQKRANAVTRELNLAGLKPGWVQALSKGDEEPNPDPGALPQEAADRRVEIYLEDK